MAGYRVERCLGAGCTNFVEVATALDVSFIDTGLALGSTYSYRARATDQAGNLSAYSNVASATTLSAPPNGGRVGAYPFDEGSGTTTADLSGQNNNGTLNGPTWTVAGKIGKALVFDGAAAYVDLGNPATLQLTGSMTVSAWINSAAFPAGDAGIVSKRGDLTQLGYQLDTTVDTGLRTIGFKLGNALGSKMMRYGASVLQLNQWYHVAGVYDAQTQTLNVYLNGTPDNGTLVGPVTATQHNTSLNVMIGRRSGYTGDEFNGTIDEVRIYNRALSPAEIQTDMNTSASAPPSGVTPPTVTSPAPGAVVSSDDATVSGTFVGSSNTGITVNGVVAAIVGNTFVAPNIQLQPGVNVVAVTLTTPNNQTVTQTFTVVSNGPAPIEVLASPTQGVAPLGVTFTINNRTGHTIQSVQADYTGAGSFANANPAALSNSYVASGIYQARFLITDSTGASYQQTVPIAVQDTAQIDQMLRAVWGGFTTVLAAGNTSQALQYFNVQAQVKYGPVLSALLPSLPQIVASFSAPQLMSCSGQVGEYVISRTINGVNQNFFIYFARDSDGVWRLDSM